MMNKLALLTLLLLVNLSFSQNIKLKSLTINELRESRNTLDPTASAAILEKKGSVVFEFNNQGYWSVVTDVIVRLKIYNKEGYKYAVAEVPYYDRGENSDEVIFEDIITYNISGDKIEKTKVGKENITTQNLKGKLKQKKVIFPNIKDGSVIEYHYILKSPIITKIPDWYFQYDIPVNKIEYTVAIPYYFIYNRILSPYFPVKETEEKERITKTHSNSNPNGEYSKSNGMIQMVSGNVTYYVTKRMYSAENIPALKEEGYVDNVKNYLSYVKYELASTIFPNVPEKKYSTEWNTVSKSIYEGNNFGKQIENHDYFEKDLKEAIAKGSQNSDVAIVIFDFVKNRMTWNGEYGFDFKINVEKAYTERTGSAAEINLMLLSMLRYAGLKANPVLLSTRDNGHLVFVNRDQFNYVIVGLEVQKGMVYLDASSKNAMPNILPVRDLNGMGRLIREDLTSSEVNLTPISTSKENILIMAKIETDGSVSGQVKTQYYDYNACVFRENYSGLNQSSYVEKLEKELTNVKIENSDIKNFNDFNQPVVESFSFITKNSSDVIAGKIHLSPMLFYTLQESPFKEEKRSYPIDFVFPQQSRYAISINIPDGYMVESVPQSAHLDFGDNIGSFKYNIAVNQANQIQVMVINDINLAMVSQEQYESLKGFYDAMVKKQTEKIVLVKKV